MLFRTVKSGLDLRGLSASGSGNYKYPSNFVHSFLRRLITTFFLTVPRVAASVALSALVIVPDVAVKVVLLDPSGTVTEAEGTGNKELLLDTDTMVPPVGAELFRVMVHVVVSSESNVVGLHPSEESATGASRLMLAVCDVPLRVAVKVAV